MAVVTQRSFAGGVLGPDLLGRADQARYPISSRTLRNMIATKRGPVTNRAGTRFICEVADSTKRQRLIEFVYSTEQTYALLFGPLTMRVIRDGVLLESSPGVPYTLVTPYTEDDLSDLQFVQQADVVTIVHPSHAPAELARSGHTSWTLTAITTAPSGSAPVISSVVAGVAPGSAPSTPAGQGATGGVSSGGSITDPSDWYKVTAWDASGESVAPSGFRAAVRFVATLADPITVSWSAVGSADGYAVYKRHDDSQAGAYGLVAIVPAGTLSWQDDGVDAANAIAEAPTASGGATTWEYVVTAVADDGTESVASASDSASGQTPTSSDPNAITWAAVSGATEYNVYRLVNGLYGYIGSAVGTTFYDPPVGGGYTQAIEPDTTRNPPQNRDLFDATGDYPSTVSYSQQRVTFANSDNDPQKVWMSRTGSFHDFSFSTPIQDDDAIIFTIAGRQVNEVRHLLELSGVLVILTSDGVWTLQGDQDGAFTPSTVNVRQRGYDGASSLAPVLIGESAVYVASDGTTVRDLAYEFSADGFPGRDLSVFAPHFFEGYTLVDRAYQKTPMSIVWFVRSDGKLLGLTYNREHDVAAWHLHDTEGGTFENVCAIPEGNETALYCVVNRTIDGSPVRYVERMESRRIDDLSADAFFVDSGLSYDGTNDGATTLMLTGGTTWSSSEDLTLEASASQFTAGDVGNEYHLTIGDVTLRCEVLVYTDPTHVTVHASENVPEAFQDVATDEWARAVDEISELDHLEGEEVAVLADGAEQERQTVTGGAITLTQPAAVVHVGLPITADLELLPIERIDGPTLMHQPKAISEVAVLVHESLGFEVGPDEDHLVEPAWRTFEDPGAATELRTGVVLCHVETGWGAEGTALIRQTSPLPLTVMAVSRIGTFGEK